MNIAVVGLWHLGEVALASLASLGHTVIGIDENRSVIERLRRGIPPIEEPGLRKLLKRYRARISYSTAFEDVRDCDCIFITYDTPVTEHDVPDTSILFNAIKKIRPYVHERTLLVVMSQVPVGTTKRIGDTLGVDRVSLPENLRLGEAIACFLTPDRVVIGADNGASLKKINSIIKGIKAPKLVMSIASAEMTKHALNAFLATSLSFTYNISDVCETVGANVADVMRAVRADARIGKDAYLDTSLGFSGGTLMRDLKTLAGVLKGRATGVPVIEAVMKTNERRRKSVARRLETLVGMPISRTRLGILGVTYKPGTSTLRRSLALELAKILKRAGARVNVFDPGAEPRDLVREFGGTVHQNAYAMARGRHGIILVTAWPEFRSIDFRKLKRVMKAPFLLFDTRNFLGDMETELKTIGFTYHGLGR